MYPDNTKVLIGSDSGVYSRRYLWGKLKPFEIRPQDITNASVLVFSPSLEHWLFYLWDPALHRLPMQSDSATTTPKKRTTASRTCKIEQGNIKPKRYMALDLVFQGKRRVGLLARPTLALTLSPFSNLLSPSNFISCNKYFE